VVARVVGTDPGTSSLDLLLLDGGAVADQSRLTPEAFRSDPASIRALLDRWAPVDLVAGPSGYGLPLVRAEAVGERDLDLMALVRPEERGADQGVIGFRSWVRAFLASGLPVVFLPGLIHLPTVPLHRKVNAIDLGTPDKLAAAALALRSDAGENGGDLAGATFALVELGSAFSAVLVVSEGQLVDASAGTRGPIGVRSRGAWDGEAAYWWSPLAKADLFRGGLDDLGPEGPDAFRESLVKHVAGLRAVTPFERIYLSGTATARTDLLAAATDVLSRFGRVTPLPNLPGAWVKHAAQGSALLADGLAGGSNSDLVARLRLREASGTVLDWVRGRGAAPPPVSP
jgi:predicted butyrate kinase (DUF1464 family)